MSTPSESDRTAFALDLTIDADLPLPPAVTESTLHALVAYALIDEEASGLWEVSFRFTTDVESQRLHREFMGLDSPTDIMTFPYEVDQMPPYVPAASGGDIVISVETAAAHAVDAGWHLEDELLFLALHGLLHLLGWNDQGAGERAAMLARQAELLDRWRNQTGCGAG